MIVEEFLMDLKKEFGGGDNKTIRVAELKKVVKNEGSGFNIFLFSPLILIFFLIYFPLFYF